MPSGLGLPTVFGHNAELKCDIVKNDSPAAGLGSDPSR